MSGGKTATSSHHGQGMGCLPLWGGLSRGTHIRLDDFPSDNSGQEPSQDSNCPPCVGRHNREVSRPCAVGGVDRKLKEGLGSETSVEVSQPRRPGR